jgi:DNA-binding transcriptional MerR regulator
MLVSIKVAAELVGVYPGQLRYKTTERYGLTVFRSEGGHRRFDYAECVEVGRRRIQELQDRIPKTLT